MTSLFKKPLHHVFLVLIIVAGAFLLSTTDAKGIRTLWTLHRENRVIVQEIHVLQTRLQELTQNIEHFHTQTEIQERLVRLQTGYLRQNELLIEWL